MNLRYNSNLKSFDNASTSEDDKSHGAAIAMKNAQENEISKHYMIDILLGKWSWSPMGSVQFK